MPHRKLVKIGDTPKLPTIQEFFLTMADRQHEEIRRLKTEIAGHPVTGETAPGPADPRVPVPDPWLLHPVRKKPGSTKKAIKRSASAKPKKKSAPKKVAKKKAAKKVRKSGRSR